MSGALRGRAATISARHRPRPVGLTDVLADVTDAADECRVAQCEADTALTRRADAFAAAIVSGASLRQIAAAAGLALGTVQRIVGPVDRVAGSVTSW